MSDHYDNYEITINDHYEIKDCNRLSSTYLFLAESTYLRKVFADYQYMKI